MAFFDSVASQAEDLVGDVAATLEEDAGAVWQTVTDWVADHPIAIESVPGSQALDIAVGGDNFVAEMNGSLVTLSRDIDDDGTGDELLFAGSAVVTPEGVQLTYDTNGDGLPDAELVTVPNSVLGGIMDLFA